MQILNIERKKIIPLTNIEYIYIYIYIYIYHVKFKKSVTYVGRRLKEKMPMIRNNVQLDISVILQVNKKVLHIAYVI